MELVEDKLNRSNYINFLIHLVQNCEKYKRSSEKQFQDFSFKEGTIKIYEIPFPVENRFRYGNSIDGVLFNRDLENWDRIKFMTYGNYISKQLENFNFISQSLDLSVENV